MQAASEGKLTIAGRKGRTGPIIPIDSAYWKGHRVKAEGLHTATAEELTTEKNDGVQSGDIYRSLKINKKEVEKFWPSSISDYDVWLRDALSYLAFGTWNFMDSVAQITSSDADEKDEIMTEKIDELLQAATEGKLIIGGKKQNSFTHTIAPIDKVFWHLNGISEPSLLHDDPSCVETISNITMVAAEGYTDLKTNKATVEKLWPQASI